VSFAKNSERPQEFTSTSGWVAILSKFLIGYIRRMTVRLKALAAAAIAVAPIVACSSSGPASQPAASPRSVDVHALASRMRTGLSKLTTAHIAVDAGPLGGSSSGDFRYANGSATASHIVLASGDQQTEVITVGSTSYAKLPQGENTSGKPWLKVSADSSNQYVRGVSDALGVANAAGSIPAVADIVDSASSAQDKGKTTVNGIAAHAYAVDVVPSQAPAGPLGSLLQQLGQKTVPIQVAVDKQNRPVRIAVDVRLGGLSTVVTISVSKFDQPLRISAPPPDQVAPH
jgi:hypothetical protein